MNALTALVLCACVAAVAFNKLFGRKYDGFEAEVARHERERR